MSKVMVVFWSQSGNTKLMAEAIGKGVEEAGKQAEVLDISKVALADLKDATSFALGCPAMGNEVLEESEMEPFVEEVEKFAKGKEIALFGSYGWGDGQWMRDWEERMQTAGATIINGEGLICTDMPDDSTLIKCRSLGKQLAD